jgi:hypothetical protein
LWRSGKIAALKHDPSIYTPSGQAVLQIGFSAGKIIAIAKAYAQQAAGTAKASSPPRHRTPDGSPYDS